MARDVRTAPDQLARAPRRTAFERRVLAGAAPRVHQLHGASKSAAIGAMRGTVVELGPGAGANMRYYAPGVHVIAIEPNVHFHDALRDEAASHGVDLEIRTLRGEQLDVDDASVDGVVGTLVLCGVDDPDAVVGEVHRVLRDGGTYFFLEHVGAEPGTRLRRIQDVVVRPHRWLFNGCETNRDTAAVIDAAGFSSTDHRVVDAGPGNAYVRLQLLGTAVR